MPKGYEGFDDDRGSDDGDQRLSAEDFFALLASGQTVVKARWSNSVTDPSIAVDRLELED